VRTLGVVVAGYCAFLQLYATQPILPLLRRLFNAGTVEVSLTVTMAAMGVACSAPFAGLLADRFGRKRIIVWSAFLLAICGLLAATSPNLYTLIFWRFLQGVFTPGVFSVTIAYINDEWPRDQIGSALSCYVSGTVLGGFSCRFISGIVAGRADWRWSFIVLGCLSLIGAFAISKLLPLEKNAHHIAIPPSEYPAAVAAHLRNRLLLATYCVGFCVLFSLVAIFTYITFYLSEPPFHLGATALGLIFLVYLIGAAANPIAGQAIDRYGHRLVLATAISAGIFGLALTFVPNVWVVCAGLAICSTGVFAAQTAGNGFVGIAAERQRALAVGLYGSFYYLGGSAGAVLPGYFWNWAGWPATAAFVAIVQLLTIGMALKFWTPRPRAIPLDESFISPPDID
jgi:predicted MFS family arabinose efflux permease